MTWSIQLTVWALPPLLAVLLALRDVGFLWPRRREQGAGGLLFLAGAVGLWGALRLVGVTAAGLDTKVLLARLAYLPAAGAPVAWVAFAFGFVGRRRELRRWPALLLYGLSLATVWIAWSQDGGLGAGAGDGGLLYGSAELEERGGPPGLSLDPAPWQWAHLAVRAGAVLWGTTVLVSHLIRRRGWRLRSVFVVAAAAVALGAGGYHLVTGPAAWWRDVSVVGFAMASVLLGWGLLRHRLLGLGPVARTLVMEELRDPVVVLDGKGRIVDVNRAAERTLGLEPYGAVPLALGTLWASSRRQPGDVHRVSLDVDVAGEADGEEASEGGGRAADGKEESGSEERGSEERGPEERTFEVTITPLDGEDEGTRGRSALLLRDVTVRDRMERELRRTSAELRRANAELERMANTDALTGLANRRRFMERLEEELGRADRYERPLAVVVADLDRFKEVNDTHGHAAGDEVLRAAARALASVCRDVDVPARIGGEEMALLLPETDRTGARTVAQRVRTRIARAVHAGPDGESFRVTASLGVAAVGPGALTAEELLQRADEALYRAKEEGRNRVVVAS